MKVGLRINREGGHSKINAWLLILFTAPIPLIVFTYLGYRWMNARTDYNRMVTQMIQRQNAVLANDAITVARHVSQLLERGAYDIQTLALVPATSQNFLKFYLSRVSQVSQVNQKDESMEMIPLPMYNEIISLNLQGDEVLRFKNGRQEKTLRRLSECTGKNLCDSELIKKAIHSPVGEIHFGDLQRWYVQEGAIEVDEGAHLPLAYRSTENIILLGIEYRYLKDILSEVGFPYERKRNLLQSYQNGNYIYVVDSQMDIIAHPKYWHVTGIDQAMGKRAVPMRTDSDEGKHPLNVVAYQGERLKDYFERLRTRSFLQKSVDIFEAPNLRGTNRVLSVAPILLSKGQFQKSGIFGYIILGCSVDYFEEPKEKYVPYY